MKFHKCTGNVIKFHKCTGNSLEFHKCTGKVLEFSFDNAEQSYCRIEYGGHDISHGQCSICRGVGGFNPPLVPRPPTGLVKKYIENTLLTLSGFTTNRLLGVAGPNIILYSLIFSCSVYGNWSLTIYMPLLTNSTSLKSYILTYFILVLFLITSSVGNQKWFRLRERSVKSLKIGIYGVWVKIGIYYTLEKLEVMESGKNLIILWKNWKLWSLGKNRNLLHLVKI